MGIFSFLKCKPSVKSKWDAWMFAPRTDISAYELAHILLNTSPVIDTTLCKISYFPEGKSPDGTFGVAGINRHFIRVPAHDCWGPGRADEA